MASIPGSIKAVNNSSVQSKGPTFKISLVFLARLFYWESKC